jgi:hypothetical protein
MAQKPLPNTAAVSHMAARLRNESEALLVLVIRVNDTAFSVDPSVSPKDAAELLRAEVPELFAHLAEIRKKRS